MSWFEKHLGGHISFRVLWWRITIYGFNAMHVAINIHTHRWGYVCFHPPMRHWPWYFYVSPNATPWAASFGIGPGTEKQSRARMGRRNWADVYRRMDRVWSASFHVDNSKTDPYWRGVKDALTLAIEELMEHRLYESPLELFDDGGETNVRTKIREEA